MMAWRSVRTRIAHSIRAALQGEVPLSTRPSEPRSPDLGLLALRSGAAPEGGRPTPPERWDLDPESGAPLPAEPATHANFPPHQGRTMHQHGWFANLALRAANGDQAAGDSAIAGIESWLRHDRPGHGVAWEHASDCAQRLLHWHAALGWLGGRVSASLRADLAGSAEWHLQHLRTRLPWGPADAHRRIAHHAGLVVGGLTFSGSPESRQLWSTALVDFARELDALTFPDGAPRSGSLGMAEQSAWIGLITAAVARANGVALPALASGSLARLSHFCFRAAGEIGSLPPIGVRPGPAPLDFGGFPLAWSAWNLSLALGIAQGDPSPSSGDDPRYGWFFTRTLPSVEPARAGWSMYTFAEDGWVIANSRAKTQPVRLISHARLRSGGQWATPHPHALWFCLGSTPILRGEADNTLKVAGTQRLANELRVARVDGKKARVEGSVKLGNRAEWQRDSLLNQARLLVTDRLTMGGSVQLGWTFGSDWACEGEGRSFKLRLNGFEVLIQLAPELTWSLEVHTLLGRGDLVAGQEITSSFEIR